ncbi:MAG: CinA family nicotinamide mononucleotide deamidase-related protein [Anaerolineae bacterium]|nr:CinA family nicotinamide mononucleotide deamidase-related protein [Anaerolineae bacterium]
MRAEIISIGTELLLGEITDTNATYIARALRDIGIDIYFRTTVGDNLDRIASAIRLGLERADVVITSGGLGPTVDDVTREAIAQATGRPLEFHQELLDQIAERFRRFGSVLTENNRQQAYAPAGAVTIENPVGTAPIFILEDQAGTVIVLPGVPREMTYLMEHVVLPWLAAHNDSPSVIRARVLRTAGIGESVIDSQITDLMKLTNPTVGLAAHSGQTDIRITAKASSIDEAEKLIQPVEADLRKRLAPYIYGVEKEAIEEVVTRLLKAKGLRVATIEAGSGGVLARRLQEAAEQAGIDPLHSQILASADDIAVSGMAPTDTPPVLAEKAAVAACKSGADYGVALIIREDADGSTASGIAVSGPGGQESRQTSWASARPDAPIWLSTHAMAMLHRHLSRPLE